MLLVAGTRAWGAPLRTNEETYGDEGNNGGYNFRGHPEWQKSISTTFIKVPAYFTLETANVRLTFALQLGLFLSMSK